MSCWYLKGEKESFDHAEIIHLHTDPIKTDRTYNYDKRTHAQTGTTDKVLWQTRTISIPRSRKAASVMRNTDYLINRILMPMLGIYFVTGIWIWVLGREDGVPFIKNYLKFVDSQYQHYKPYSILVWFIPLLISIAFGAVGHYRSDKSKQWLFTLLAISPLLLYPFLKIFPLVLPLPLLYGSIALFILRKRLAIALTPLDSDGSDYPELVDALKRGWNVGKKPGSYAIDNAPFADD